MKFTSEAELPDDRLSCFFITLHPADRTTRLLLPDPKTY